MLGREEGVRNGRFHARGGTKLPETTRCEDLLQMQQWPRARAEQLLRALDIVAGPDTAADVEKRKASCAETLCSLDEERRRCITALGQRDVEESVSGAIGPAEQ